MAGREGFFDDLIHIGLKLPWRTAVFVAAGSFLVLHFIAISTLAPAATATLAGLGTVVGHQVIHMFALFLQYLVPVVLLIDATIGYFKQSQTQSPVSSARTNPKAISEMSWREFERLVGEAFRQRGFTVTGFGGSGPDGRVDLALVTNGERFLVQCKHWRKEQVGVTVVRELSGVMAAVDAHGGYVVTGGQFTREAREFARGTKIELMDGDALETLIGCVRTNASAPVVYIKAASQSAPACPHCGTAMVRRVAKQGKHAGHSFWGCQQYPKCSGILQIS
jgi:restriction system protein